MVPLGAVIMDDAGRGTDHAASLSMRDFGRLSRFIYDTCGIKMPEVKKTMLEARLQKRLRALGMHSFCGLLRLPVRRRKGRSWNWCRCSTWSPPTRPTSSGNRTISTT